MSSSTVNGFLAFCDRCIRPSWCGLVLNSHMGQGRSLACRFGACAPALRGALAVDVDQAIIKAEFIKFGQGLFNLLKGLFLSALQKLGALRI